ncbi:MAG: EAL domain-containing protein [Sphaerospermopsis sp. SIO1G1]|nr:EAL domain-containing protein [Sphaerospermopsis sp. SIO1G1]
MTTLTILLTTISVTILLVTGVVFIFFLSNIVNIQNIQYQQQIETTEVERLLLLHQISLESTRDGILILDDANQIIGFNQSFLKIWDFPESVIQSSTYQQLLRRAVKKLDNPKYYIRKLREINNHPEKQINAINDSIFFNDGRIFYTNYHTQKIDNHKVGRIWSFQDITYAGKNEFTVNNYHQFYDPLTNLPNRLSFKNSLIASLASTTQNHKLAVCILDLNRFKNINDNLGYSRGDKLLKIVADRIQENLNHGDIIARWGGDEFSLLLRKVSKIEDVIQIQERILAAFRKGFAIDNQHINLSISIGIAISPHHGINTDTLIKNADTALSCAKLQKANHYVIYHPDFNSQKSELFTLENDLYNALERGELKVYYQPQINSFSGEITQMEALLRWEHPEMGLISPSKFIPIAEETGLIIPISEWVLKTACLQNKKWQEYLNLPDLSIAVNLSTSQFQQSNLVNTIKKVLTETQLAPKHLELEITETVAMQDIELTRNTLHVLNKIGVEISIDDFGTGYSSLSYLKDIPVTSLKIDQSFVKNLLKGDSHTAITTAIIDLAHGLNLGVVAEGVETEEQFNWLKVMKCEVVQGYLFSHPLSAEEATRILKFYQPYKLESSYLAA